MTKTEFIELLKSNDISHNHNKEKINNAAVRIMEDNMEAFNELAK